MSGAAPFGLEAPQAPDSALSLTASSVGVPGSRAPRAPHRRRLSRAPGALRANELRLADERGERRCSDSGGAQASCRARAGLRRSVDVFLQLEDAQASRERDSAEGDTRSLSRGVNEAQARPTASAAPGLRNPRLPSGRSACSTLSHGCCHYLLPRKSLGPRNHLLPTRPLWYTGGFTATQTSQKLHRPAHRWPE